MKKQPVSTKPIVQVQKLSKEQQQKLQGGGRRTPRSTRVDYYL